MKEIYSIFIFVLMIAITSCDSPNNKKQPLKGKIWQTNEKGDSVLMRYNDKGKLLSYTTYKNGMKNGIAKKFHENGNVEFTISYKDNFHNGKTQWFYENGRLYRETYYKMGIKNGLQKKYYETGKIMAEIPFENGMIQPGLKEYNKSGKLKKKYPELIIEPVDNLAFENKYTLRCYLSNKSKKAKFSRWMKGPTSGIGALVQVKNIDGIANFDFFVSRGGYLMSKEKIRVEFKTALGNTYVIEKEYNLAVDN